ncbi:hypothetical protein CR513_07908, partial [Mucuna pruriens]
MRRKLALEVVEGDAIKLYKLLWWYNAELRRIKPSLHVQPRLEVFCTCLKPCKKEFVSGCKPFIELLIDVGKDENDQHFHIAIIAVET